MKLKLNFKISRRNLELVGALGLAALAFLVSWRWAAGVVDRSVEITVVAAARDLAAPRTLAAGDVKTISIRRVVAPATALVNPGEAPDRTLMRNLSENQIITTNDIAVLDISGSGYKVPAGLEGFSVNGSWFAGPLPGLKAKDRVTIIASGAGSENIKNTGIIERGILVLEVVSGSEGGASGIMLGVTEATAVKLLQSKANGLLLHLLLDGTGPVL